MFKKKKLTLRKIHELYLLLKPFLPEQDEAFLIDQVEKIVQGISNEAFYGSLEILHPKKDFSQFSVFGLLSLLIEGLRANDFFEYANFVKGLNGKRTHHN